MIRRPLKLKWGKKSGRYDLSQDIYVLSVFVGDSMPAQCTLSSESTARQCVDYLREKLQLSQDHFFSLRYHLKCSDPDERSMRWVEMDKPLRKQLEKWGCRPREVHLGILYHTPNVFALSDPTARSIYYELLKWNVVHEKYIMDVDKYVNLAAYSLQVEFGNYNPNTHTAEFTRSLPLLPSHLYRSSQLVDNFMLRVLSAYERLNDMQPTYAAFLYIVDAQQCEGYAEEFFTAKDDESTEVKIGYSLEGLIVKRCHGPNLKYLWNDLKDISHSKRSLFIKSKDTSMGVFTFVDNETARYVSMVFGWQWHYSLTDAVKYKSVPMSISNLHGEIRTFAPKKPLPKYVHGKMDSNGTTESVDLSSIPVFARTPNAINSAQSLQSVGNRVRSATSLSAQQISTALSTPSLAQSAIQPHMGQFNKHRAEQRPANPSPSGQNERIPLRQFLEPQTKTTGSSPEIHMIGTGNLRNYGNSHLMRRAQSNARGYQNRIVNSSDEKFIRQQTLSYPKWKSTPDLISTATQMAAFRKNRTIIAHDGQIPSTSASSGSSSGRRFAPMTNGPKFSQGRVISATRLHGQSIVYPMPHTDTSVEPPPYRRQQLYCRQESFPQSSSIASTDSSVQPIGSEDESLSEESEPNSWSRSRSPLALGESSEQSMRLNNRNPKNGVSNDETLIMIRDKLETPKAVDAEFAAIIQKRLSAGVSTSQHPENQNRNRKGNVFPYEDTRVLLHPHKRNTDGYINASNVEMTIGEKTLKYIVAQAPMKTTMDDFWQMIWESGARLIVCLVNPHQTEKSDTIPPYWPTKAKEKLSVHGFFIKMQSSTTTKFQTTSVLLLKCLRSGERRFVYHLHSADFGPHGVPSSESAFLGFIDAVNSVKIHIENERLRETDSGVFSIHGDNKSRSRSVTRNNLTDLTNQNRSQSVEGGGFLKRRLRFSAAPQPSVLSNSSAESGDSWKQKPEDVNAQTGRLETPPTVIHCTDGAAESGIYILVECLIQSIEHNVTIDVPNTLKNLRNQRMYLVRNLDQYRFVYTLLENFLAQSRLI